MAMCYKKLWKLLIDRDMTRADLRDKTGLSPATLAKMSKGEAIGANVLERICETMQCNVGDVMDYVPNESASGQVAEAKRVRRLEGEILGDGTASTKESAKEGA